MTRYFHEIFTKNVWERIPAISTVCSAQCGNYGILVSHFFGKNFVKATVLPNKSLKSWFDEIFFQWDQIFHFSTLCSAHVSCACEILNFFTWNHLLLLLWFFFLCIINLVKDFVRIPTKLLREIICSSCNTQLCLLFFAWNQWWFRG